MSPDDLLDEWRRGLRISVRAHYEAAKHFERLHLMLSLPAVLVSALLGSAVFASFQHSDVSWIKTMMAILSVATIGLSSLQAALRFAERAERHKGKVGLVFASLIFFGSKCGVFPLPLF
jgi:chromate transport protein ChrA